MGQMDFLSKVDNAFNVSDGRIYRSVIDEAERILIEKALAKTKGNQIMASQVLGLNRNTLRTKIRKLNIRTEQFKR